MTPAPVSRMDRAYLDIRHRIITGACRPGTPLSESALARMVRASRTPIREALCRLLEEGYVERVPGRGFQVARITVQVVRDTFEVRRLLESTAAARAAEGCEPATARQLQQFAPVPSGNGDLASMQRAAAANERFHLAVAQASGNVLLADLVRNCLDQVTRFMAHGTQLRGAPQRATQEHVEIAAAIAKRDAAGARAAMERHLDECSREFMQALVQGGEGDIAV